MKALIIEDEVQARSELLRLLKKVDSDIEILATLGTVEEAIEWLDSHEEPGVIFMDIQLSDGLSFEIFEKLEIESPIIFTTAFDEYAIKAFEQNSIDYLLKPIEESDLEKALNKLDKLRAKSGSDKTQTISKDVIQQILNQRDYKTRFLVRMGDVYRYIPISEAAYFYSSSEVTFLVTKSKKKFSLEYTLDQLMSELDPANFFRVSRKYICSIDSVVEVRKHFNSRLKLIIEPDPSDDILISRKRVPDFLLWMEK